MLNAARVTQPMPPLRQSTCDRCGEKGWTRTVNDEQAKRWCLDCIALPPAPRELSGIPGSLPEVARGSRP